MTTQRIYYWVHHTGRYDGNTGVQRVVRGLGASFAGSPDVDLVPVRWCAEREEIVRAERNWLAGLARYGGPVLPELEDAGEPLHTAEADRGRLDGAWLLLPEVPHVGGNAPDAPGPTLPVALDYARYYGLRTAVVFYDLIPLRVPGYEEMAPGHAAYALALAAADLVLPISRTAGDDLQVWWEEQGHDLARLPVPRPVPLPAEMAGVQRVEGETPRHGGNDGAICFLAVGTVEPRKNQLALMRAVNRLRQVRPALDIYLDVVGGLHHAVADAVQQEAAASEGRIRLHGYLPDDQVRALTRACHATAFISLAEGYGLPVVESLWQGKPCLCSDFGSMAEIAEGGGCLTVDPRDPEAVERALERLAGDAGLACSLAQEARSRELTSWQDYGQAVLAQLMAAPALTRVALIEGTLGSGEAVAAGLEGTGTAVRRLHWRPDTQALLPGFRGGPAEIPRVSAGDLRGLWAVLPLSTTGGPAEAMRIEDEARGLGLRLALVAEAVRPVDATWLAAMATADLTVFASEGERDAALDVALRRLPRTATLRHRFRVADGASGTLAAIAAERPRISAAAPPHRPRRVFYWTGLTVTQPFNTGVQRVTRALGATLHRLGVDVVPVKWDAAIGCMAPLSAEEASALAAWGGPPARAIEPLPTDLVGEWLLVPEVTVPTVPPDSTVARLGRSLGMRVVAIFYDLIPAKMTEVYPQAVVDAFAAYWALFSDADLALPISWTVAGDLRRYLAERGLRIPPLVPCPLAGDLPGVGRRRAALAGPAPGLPLRLLAVGTWEPRKNYPRLLRALVEARRLSPERPIELTIVGRRAGYAALDAEMEGLAARIGSVTLFEHVSDAELLRLYRTSHATVFGSWEEGFGLPVLESLWRGLPCLCHDGSAMAEVAPGGGALAVDMLDEAAIAQGIARLAGEEGLLQRLGQEAVERPIRDWDEYGRDVLAAMAQVGTAPGWPLPAILTGAGKRPLLSCAVTTYNRAHWLAHTLPRLIEAARPFGDLVEVVVCDNASTDGTPEVVARYEGSSGLISRRNPVNVGMLGNLGATTRATNGAYVWLIGDDDLVLDGAIGAVLQGLQAYPDVEMAYMNYAYTSFDAPEQISDPGDIVRNAKAIGYGGPNRLVHALREVAALNENLFTAIYACAFRRDHALRAYQQDVGGPPFSSLLTCVPSSVYALSALQDRPAWWVGQPAMVVNMNVSWLRWALLWHLERMPDLFDMAELAGIDPVRVDRHRAKHCGNAGEWTGMALMRAEDAIRERVSVARLLERCKHVGVFGPEVPRVHEAYADAWVAERVIADRLEPEALFARYGLDALR